MPTPEQILNGLATAANSYTCLSITWHIVVLLFLVYIFWGKRPSSRVVIIGLLLLLLSVGIVSLLISNPFNAIVFIAASLLLGLIAFQGPKGAVEMRWDLVSVVGLILAISGLVYPHFMEDASWYDYLYKAPTGLVPCPTLLVVIGITLMFQGFMNKRWMLYLSLVGIFYGVFGVFRLHVYLDAVLIAGSSVLFIRSFYVPVSVDQNNEKME